MEIEIMMFWLSSIYIGPIWALMWFAPKHDFTKKFVGNIRLTVLPSAYHMQLLRYQKYQTFCSL